MAKVREMMTLHPHTIGAQQSVAEAARCMRAFRIRHLPVLDGGVIVGILSDRDIELAESLGKETQTRVQDVMSPEPYIVDVEDDLSLVVATMATRKIGSAIVKDGAAVTGILTTIDVLRSLARDVVEDQQLHLEEN